MTTPAPDITAIITELAATHPHNQPLPPTYIGREEAAELRAEDRAARRGDVGVERPDRYGRDADWNWPRGYGGDR